MVVQRHRLDAQLLVEGRSWLASIGEFWILGYLIIRGVRRTATPEASPTPALVA